MKLENLFTSDESEAFLTVNILRHWDGPRIHRFAGHLIGDAYQQMEKTLTECQRVSTQLVLEKRDLEQKLAEALKRQEVRP